MEGSFDNSVEKFFPENHKLIPQKSKRKEIFEKL